MGKYLIKDGTRFGNALKKAKKIAIKENTPVRLVFNNTKTIVHKNSNLKKVFDWHQRDAGCNINIKSKKRNEYINLMNRENIYISHISWQNK